MHVTIYGLNKVHWYICKASPHISICGHYNTHMSCATENNLRFHSNCKHAVVLCICPVWFYWVPTVVELIFFLLQIKTDYIFGLENQWMICLDSHKPLTVAGWRWVKMVLGETIRTKPSVSNDCIGKVMALVVCCNL